MDEVERRRANRDGMRRLRERRRLNGTPDRRAIADALLETALRRRPETLFAAVEALTDAGYDADEVRYVIAGVIATANVDTPSR